jgi:hypothetical protein
MRKTPIALGLGILMAVAVGCEDGQALAELREMKAEAETEKQNVAQCRRLFEEIDKGNAGYVMELFAPDVASYSPSGSTEPVSRQELLRRTEAFLQGFPDLHHTVDEVTADGDMVTIRFTARGTHQGEFAGIPATGHPMQLSAISVMRFEGGKVVEVWQEADTLGMMRQLGLELTPAAGGQ